MPGRKPVSNLAVMCRALGSETRLQILKVLARQECFCGELVSLFDMAQSTVSHHLKVLRQAGFIDGHAQGPYVCYWLNRDRLEEFKRRVSEEL